MHDTVVKATQKRNGDVLQIINQFIIPFEIHDDFQAISTQRYFA